MHFDETRLENEGILLLCDETGHSLPIKINPSRKALKLSLRVSSSLPIATLPLRRCRDLSVLKEFILTHAQWIFKTVRQQQASSLPAIPSPCLPGCRILLWGEWIPFELQPSPQNPARACFTPRESFTIKLPWGLADYKPLLETSLRKLSVAPLTALVEQISQQLQIPYNRLTFRSMKSKWGSCRSNRNISLNWRMIHAPLWAQEYLVIHELTHLKQMNHSPQFWALVAQHSPRFQEARKWFSEHACF